MYGGTPVPSAVNAGLPAASATSGAMGHLWLALLLLTVFAVLAAAGRLIPRRTK